MEFNQLTIKQTISYIDNQAKTLVFDVPAELAEHYQWQAGQHITLSFDIDGKAVRRSYTISASPHTHTQNQHDLQITVKRVKDGLVSNHINDNITTGDTVLVAPANGNFVLEPTPNRQRTHYFFGAGSGITPLWAMINTVLIAEPHSRCHLLYANRDDTSIIYQDELAELQAHYPERLSVSHILSKPCWTSSFNYWKSGRIDEGVISEFIQQHPPYAQDSQYYICAPTALLSLIRDGLQAIDVPANRIHFETFGGSNGSVELQATTTIKDYGNGISLNPNAVGMASQMQVYLDGGSHSVPVAENQTLLDAMLKANVNAPYACQSGVCGSCKCRVGYQSNSKIAMRANMALDDNQVKSGFFLTCQAVALSERLEIEDPY